MQTDEEMLLGDVGAMPEPPACFGKKTSLRAVAMAVTMSLLLVAFVGMVAPFMNKHTSNSNFVGEGNVLQEKTEICDVDTPCANCDREGLCDKCHAEAKLTCCEEEGGSRATCCEKDDIKSVFTGENDSCTKTCADEWHDCSVWECCSKHGNKCFAKNAWYAQCKPSCEPGEIDPYDNLNWSCTELGESQPSESQPQVNLNLTCSMNEENCAQSGCCQEFNKTCYKKDDYWSACRTTGTCVAGENYSEDLEQYRTPWDCTEVTV